MTSLRQLRSLVSDVRALGATAPVRAWYELSKRAGGHALLFGRLSTKQPEAPRTVLPLPVAIPDAARERTLQDARSIGLGEMPVFGLQVPASIGSQVAPDSGGTWSGAPWWQVDIRSDDRLADVKWTWEIGRHRHLLVLARAEWLNNSDTQSLLILGQRLRSWLAENPPERGVHWYSNLEIALRALVWLQILSLVGDRLPDDVRREMHQHLLHSGRHLVVDLPYTVSSMRNNHMLGDALGLLALGKAFDKPLWQRIGNHLFDGQLARHMRPDGSMIEDSLSYHRFVTEMLAVRVLLGDATAEVLAALASSGAYLARLGVFDGDVPQYGDWDEGRVLGSSGNPLDVAGSAALALSMTKSGASEQWREAYDECAWYAPVGSPRPAPPAERAGNNVGGGFARTVCGPWTVYLKAGGGTSHQHADLCSTVFQHQDQWVVGDPGTGAYNGPIEQRNAFRTSGAHSVLRIDDADQLGAHRAFRWRYAARGVVGPALALSDGRTVMWGAHNAYRRLPGGGRVARLTLVGEQGVVVADVAEGAGGQRWAMTLPLHPAVELEGDDLRLPDGTMLELRTPGQRTTVRGQEHPYAGWWSRTYGHTEPSTWVALMGTLSGPVVWSVVRRDAPRHAVLADGLQVDDIELRVGFTREALTLTLSASGRDVRVVYARLAA